MSRRLLNPDGLPRAPGFSHVAVASGGAVAYISGQVALTRNLSVIGVGDLRTQTISAMENLGTALSALGATWDDVIHRTVYTLCPTEFQTITDAIEEVQESTTHPAQTLVGVTGLAIDGLLIEIQAVVHVPPDTRSLAPE